METTGEDLKHKNKQIAELISDLANISMSDDKKMEVREKIQTHLRRVEEETKRLMPEITEELEGLAVPMSQEVAFVCKRIDCVNSVLRSLATSCFNTGKKHKEALDALEAFLELNEAFYEINKEKAELEIKLLEMVSGSVVMDDQSEKKYEAEEERNEMNSISSNNEVENEKVIEAARLKDGLRRSKRFVKEPVSTEEHVKDTKAKGKVKGKKRA
ncbi:hypothetical protein POM88_047866 [Heracleum sosnowskyi]|uniref:RAB6-interacting golgin n=1 Tax=Heracleum sosnowskyi TaxID=360622 RepID=A0AAD8GUZ9_9APIA|nr:hypothetical protein POM88_047866 [Heracleum sosnowskyi]